MLTFVAFKWYQPGYRTTYTAHHVNRWAAQVRHFYHGPMRLVVVTDDAAGIGPGIEVVPLWGDFASLANRHGKSHPSCYRRLRIWADDAADLIGERIVLMDLDTTIVGDLGPLVDRPEDVVFWRDPNKPVQYNGGFYMLRAGTRPQVWRDFKGQESIDEAHRKGFRGSDQAWISLALGPSAEAVWTETDGVLSYRRDVRRHRSLPAGARVICFHGSPKPWDAEVQDWARGPSGVIPKRRTALVLGGSRSVWEDAEEALALFEPETIIAVNDMIGHWARRIDHAVSLHPEKMHIWIAKRSRRGFNGDYTTWAHKYGKYAARVDRKTDDWAGSSGLFAVKVALELGYQRIVLAGVPMQADTAHFFAAKPWHHADSLRKGWSRRLSEIKPFVRSMSGWTRDVLGSPTEEWLAGLNEGQR